MATAFVPLALTGYAIAATAWFALRRSLRGRMRTGATVTTLVSLAGVLVHAALLVPAYAGQHASGRPDVTVMTSNLRLGQADAADVVRIARESGAGVVVLEEVTEDEYLALAGLRQELPYVAGLPEPGAFGTVVLSRYPLQDVAAVPLSKGAWGMRVAAPRPFTLLGLHTSQPMGWPDKWRADFRLITEVVRNAAGPLVVAGDFNATLDHGPIRRLLGLGLADAARQANSGWQPTWPGAEDAAGALPFGVSVLTLDHVLVSRQLSAISTKTFRVGGSDHRALVARLALR
ncbi:endonuclease/exonuclease/phosphatase (EEP) superfamily protein YafD [Marmoricola sp. URHA0025 HA25]